LDSFHIVLLRRLRMFKQFCLSFFFAFCIAFCTAKPCDEMGLQYSESCEGDKMRMYCPDGLRIFILDAYFGRNDTISCVKSNYDVEPDVTCYTLGVTEFLKTFCNGKQHCSTSATENFAGKVVCPAYIKKFLRVTYECRHIDNKGFACEDDRGILPLQCQEGTLIRTKGAFYGRRADENDRCLASKNITEDCGDQSAWWHFKKICDGRPYCDVEPNMKMFNSTCSSNVTNYLELEYSCSECRNEYVWDAMCDLWAWTGECDLNPSYMMDQCRRSCWGCQHEAPLCTNYAGDRDCDYWVTQGFCESNQAWMIPYCYKACTGCDARPTQCINYSYNDTYCDSFASDCASNPGYMWPMCAKTCFNCSVDEEKNENKLMCVNSKSDADCDAWAANGECQSNPIYMMRQCTKSCLGCAKDLPVPCKNNHHNGTECEKNRSKCYDTSDLDAFHLLWTECWQTCSGCNPVCENEWEDDTQCQNWADDGLCDTNTDKEFMWNNCFKSCSKCTARCENLLGDDAQCELYRNEGECKSNYPFMKYYCNRACNLCEDDKNKAGCENLHGNETECEQWAKEGECINNLKFMIPYCRKSCHKCEERTSFGFLGNQAIEGEMVSWTKDMTVITDVSFNKTSYVANFAAYFVNNHTFEIQIWRPLNYASANYFQLIYKASYTPKFLKSAESFKPTRCVQVEDGDKIGFTTKDMECPVGHNEHVYPDGRLHEVYSRRLEDAGRPFDLKKSASMFAISVVVEDACSI